ncbi:MAG TPA: hypothetical protein VL326_04655 [Kofleriaceae bacterium]|nr:hypothetical protein [Kofleriaceae bacterium]
MRTALLLLVAATGCASFKPVTRTVRTQDLANPDRTRLTGRFIWDEVGSKDPEHPPPGQSPESVTDVAVLGVADNRTCVYFTMRTGAKHDAPFGEWAININGEPVFPEQETRGQSVVQVEGERTVFDGAYLGNTAAAALTITQPTTDEYQIIERAAWFCSARPTGPKVSFALGREYAGMKMREQFVWNIVQ